MRLADAGKEVGKKTARVAIPVVGGLVLGPAGIVAGVAVSEVASSARRNPVCDKLNDIQNEIIKSKLDLPQKTEAYDSIIKLKSMLCRSTR